MAILRSVDTSSLVVSNVALKKGATIVADQAGAENRVQDALDHTARAVALAPDDPRVWISRGEALLAAGRKAEAREAADRAERALRTQPDDAYFAADRLADLQHRLAGRR